MLLLHDSMPAVLEIGHGSFDALEQLVQSVGSEGLSETAVRIAIARTDGRLAFTFTPED